MEGHNIFVVGLEPEEPPTLEPGRVLTSTVAA